MDFGYEGLVSTMETLDNAGISFVGAGINKEQAEKPFIIEKDVVRDNIKPSKLENPEILKYYLAGWRYWN